MVKCCFLQLFNRGFANASFGFVDDAKQGEVIVWVGKYAEIGDDIFDLCTLLEAHTADEFEVEPLFGKPLFQRA